MTVIADPVALMDDSVRHEFSERGAKYYREHLQAVLEPGHNGKGLAFYPDTGEYVVADDTTLTGRAMGDLHPEGGFVVRKIGPEPDYALAGRLLAEKQRREYEERQKMATTKAKTELVFINKDEIRKIIDERNEKTGFIPDPTATPQRARERMRACGVRAEDNIGSTGIIAARDQKPLC